MTTKWTSPGVERPYARVCGGTVGPQQQWNALPYIPSTNGSICVGEAAQCQSQPTHTLPQMPLGGGRGTASTTNLDLLHQLDLLLVVRLGELVDPDFVLLDLPHDLQMTSGVFSYRRRRRRLYEAGLYSLWAGCSRHILTASCQLNRLRALLITELLQQQNDSC